MENAKAWYLSRTIWGALIAIAASLGSAFGIVITQADQTAIADIALQVAGTAGALVAIYGRISARRSIS